jgi:pyruvate-formate lyase-activating enzyme
MSPPPSQTMALLEKRDVPPMIILDITNVCNMRCIHCPQPQIQSTEGFQATHMSGVIYETLLSELRHISTPTLLRFVGDGEPMLHPQAIDMLARAATETACVVNLTTNGTRLASSESARLLRAGVHMIDISLDALTKPLYETVRQGSRYETVISNVFALLEARRRLHAHTRILVSFVLQAENEREVDAFRSFWEPLVDFVSIRNLHSANNRVKQGESVERSRALAIDRFPCAHLWRRLVVDFAGRIKFCPTDWGQASVIGHVLNGGLRKAWQQVRALRAQHLGARIPGDSICAHCTDWATTPWDRGYERIVDTLIFQRDALCPGQPLLPSITREAP